MKKIKNLVLLLALGLITFSCTPEDVYTEPAAPITQPVVVQKCSYRVVKYNTVGGANIVMSDTTQLLPLYLVPYIYEDADGVFIPMKQIKYGEVDFYTSAINYLGGGYTQFGYIRVDIYRDANY